MAVLETGYFYFPQGGCNRDRLYLFHKVAVIGGLTIHMAALDRFHCSSWFTVSIGYTLKARLLGE